MKRSKLKIKDLRIAEADYRGFIAVLLVIGLIISYLAGMGEAARVLGPLAGMAAGWYFGGRRSRE